MPLRNGEVLIDDGNAAVPPAGQSMGLSPRNYGMHAFGALGIPMATTTVPKIPRSEWSDRIKELEDKKALLSDIRMTAGPNGGPIPSLDQNGKGYCWAHSTVSAALLSRAKAGQPFADLSAYAIACIIKYYQDEGGWNGESMEFLRSRGCPTADHWPQRSMNASNDNPLTWANAALNKDTEWIEIAEGDFDMQMTLLLMGHPHALDLNWWGHSVCAADPVEIERGSYGVRIWNSWGDSWSDQGMGVLTESNARNNGAIALCVMLGD